MPLIIITGTPCSGKTHRARQLLLEFESRSKTAENDTKRSVVYISSHHASLDPPIDNPELYEPPQQSENPRDQIYDLARFEKTARAEEFSAIKRLLDKNVVVIADAPNYIKGFRYQLFCEAKAAGTRSVVVHTAAREDECRSWNNARLNAWGWEVEDAEHADHNGVAPTVTGPKIGKDVLGELEPESHTAVYGDRIVSGPRSRSSSMGAVDSDDETGSTQGHKAAEDTMTLKSLYITDRNTSRPTSTSTTVPLSNGSDQPVQNNPAAPSYDLPPATPPSPRSSLPYSSKTFTSLLMRYEPPSPFTRWDTPLFTVPSTDAHPPYAEIWSAMFPAPAKSTSKKALAQQRAAEAAAQRTYNTPPSNTTNTNDTTTSVNPLATPSETDATTAKVKQHAATVLPTASAPDALQILESTTGEVTKLVLAAARAAGAADGNGGEISIVVPLSNSVESGVVQTELELDLSIPEGTGLSQPVLQRLRRKYTQIQKGGIAHGQGHAQGRRNVAEGFVRFLEKEWEA